jgi:uncharacterized protein
MIGYRVIFSTIRGRQKDGKSLVSWLMETAMSIGVSGATVVNGSEGFGRDRELRKASFFELNEQPVEVIMVMGTDEVEKLFKTIKQEKVEIFYTKSLVEYGIIGKE